MGSLVAKKILLGVTGGIAAYKVASLIRLLREGGAEVQVVMTRSAQAFVTPLTLQCLSGRKLRMDLLDCEDEHAMGHIALARWADRVLIVPASADFLARLAHGRADDLLSTLCLATQAPLAVAPAMNRVMWRHSATQANIQILQQRGVLVWGPEEGDQACGEHGFGRMSEPNILLGYLQQSFAAPILQGKRVMITAGPTREAIDPVRFLGNRSTGKMGYAIAKACCDVGAEVVLISGPVGLSAPCGVELILVESAAAMHEAVMARVGACDVFIGAAAVADYTVVEVANQKIKKSGHSMHIAMQPTVDIIAEVASLLPKPFVVGFAAETEQVEAHARAKLAAKGLDMIVANQVGWDCGFGTDVNVVQIILQDGKLIELSERPKGQIAQQLVQEVARALLPKCEEASV